MYVFSFTWLDVFVIFDSSSPNVFSPVAPPEVPLDELPLITSAVVPIFILEPFLLSSAMFIPKSVYSKRHYITAVLTSTVIIRNATHVAKTFPIVTGFLIFSFFCFLAFFCFVFISYSGCTSPSFAV